MQNYQSYQLSKAVDSEQFHLLRYLSLHHKFENKPDIEELPDFVENRFKRNDGLQLVHSRRFYQPDPSSTVEMLSIITPDFFSSVNYTKSDFNGKYHVGHQTNNPFASRNYFLNYKDSDNDILKAMNRTLASPKQDKHFYGTPILSRSTNDLIEFFNAQIALYDHSEDMYT